MNHLTISSDESKESIGYYKLVYFAIDGIFSYYFIVEEIWSSLFIDALALLLALLILLTIDFCSDDYKDN